MSLQNLQSSFQVSPLSRRRMLQSLSSGFGFLAFSSLATLAAADDDRSANRLNLNKAYKELIIAALLYHNDDREGMAEAILQQYARDIHGHLARYAREVLEGREAADNG